MARVVSEERGPRRGTVIPGEARLYSGDVDVTDAYEVEIAATGHVHVRRYWGDPPVTHWSIDSPVFGHDRRHPIGPVVPDGSDLGLGPVVLEPESMRPPRTTTGLIEWLAAALDTLETEALRAAAVAPVWLPHRGRADTVHALVIDADRSREQPPGAVRALADGNTDLVEHIALHDPQSVRARIGAERALLREHGPDDPCGSPLIDSGGHEYRLPCDVVRWLAYGHRHDHPGYQSAWRPDGAPAAVS